MGTTQIENFEDLTPYVRKHLVPAIEEAVEVCVKSFFSDPFNDNWTFGTHFWKNSWNRFKALSDLDDCPFNVYGQGNEYKLKIGPYILRHHRIDRKTKIPKAGKAAKSSADMIQLKLWGDEWDAGIKKENIIIAIDADVDDGLREVFVGELERYSPNQKKYQWARRIPVYLAEDATPSSDRYVQFTEGGNIIDIVPDEEIPEVTVGLDEFKTIQNGKRKG